MVIVGKFTKEGEGKIIAGKNLSINKSVKIIITKGAELVFGDNIDVNQEVIIGCKTRITIGAYSIIGPRTIIFDSDWHGIDGLESQSAPIKIGNHVWICANVTILKGITIGDNAIVGACSVVTRDIDASSIVAGNPARKIGVTQTGYTYVKHHKDD